MNNLAKTIKEYSIITLGLFIFTLGWSSFLIPSGIAGGGVSGIGAIIYFATNQAIPVAASYFVINFGLLLIALKVLGKGFGIKTIYAIAMSSLFFWLFEQFITVPVVKEKFMAAIIGGVMGGVGVGITFSQGGSTGGTDVIALMINKYRNISPGRLIMYIDLIIISSSFFVWNDLEIVERFELIVYGYVVMAVTAYAVDLVISGVSQSLQIFIFSDKHEAIAKRIAEEAQRGITIINGKGWHSQAHQTILMVMIRKSESSHLYRIVKDEDPNAFMSVSSVMGVYGKGFDSIGRK
ncbi:MAG: YitT family protein [Bacteroidales bacterium]|jgi:uncharacterized membrane-anchored protein YitT (DUF2179 family)|nr:YitT family protein [Bacteroidales bacterium]